MTLKLKVNIDVSGQDNTTKVFKSVGASAEAMAAKITAISSAWMAFGQSMAHALAEPIRQAVEAENAQNKLATAMKVAGVYSDTAADQLGKYADELERASGIQSESIQGIMARGLALKMTTAQTQGLAEASTLLAKATGVDVNEASSQLIATLTGQARELRKTVDGVGHLTEAQLRHGEAIAVVQERYRSFIGSDLATSEGSWKRVQIAIGNFGEALGLSILKGVNLSSVQGGLVSAIDKITAALIRNEPSIIRVVDAMTSLIVDGIDKAVPAIERMIDKLVPLLDKLDDLGNVLTITSSPLRMFVAASKSVVDGGQAMAEEIDRVTKSYHALTDAEQQGPPRKAMMPLSFSMSSNNNPSAPAAPKFGGFKGLSEDKAAHDAALEAQKQLNTELAAQEGKLTSDLLAEHTQRMMKVLDLEQKAAKGGINISLAADNLRAMYARELSQKLEEEEHKRAQAGRKAFFETNAKIAELMGNHEGVIRASYVKQEEELKDFLDQKLISEKEYQRRVAELQHQADEDVAADNLKRGPGRGIARGLAKAGITHDDGTPITADEVDAAGTKAVGYINAAKDGVNSLVGKIGSMFGPFGDLIASIFQMFNQTPEQFSKMFDSILQSFMDAPKNLLANIPILITKSIESMPGALQQGMEDGLKFVPKLILDAFSAAIAALPKMLGRIFSAGFWSEIAKNVFTALRDAFRNFFSVLFSGKSIYPEADKAGQQAAKRETATFGSDDPNAGGGEFKIKDARLGAQRKATQSFEESFDSTVEKGGKSFTDMLKEAWDATIQRLSDFFSHVGDVIWKGLMDAKDKALEIGKKIWDGIIQSTIESWKIAKAIWDALIDASIQITKFSFTVAKAIWDCLVTLVTNVADALYPLGKAIWDAVVKSSTMATQWAVTIGKAIWDAVVDSSIKATDFAMKLAKSIWDALVTLATNLAAALGPVGKAIWDAVVSSSLLATQWAVKIGKAIWDATIAATEKTADALFKVGKLIWDGLLGAVGAAAKNIADIGKMIWDGLLAVVKWPKLPELPASLSNFKWPSVPELAASIKNFKWPSLPSLTAKGEDIWKGLSDAFDRNRDWIKSFGGSMWDGLSKGFSDSRDWIASFGTSIWNGFSAALSGGWDWLLGWFKALFSNALGGLTGGGGGGGDPLHGVIPGHNAGGMVSVGEANPRLAAAFAAGGALRFAAGGMVPGAGWTDTVPAVLTPGERVLSRAEVARGGGGGGTTQNVVLNFNVAAGAKLDRDAVREATPLIVEAIRRASAAGDIVVRKNGIA